MIRYFCIGSEWLYYKIYTGVKITDTILLEKLYPIIEQLQSEQLIDKWFFLRFKDPQNHFRIRFHCQNPENTFVVMARLYPVLNELLKQDLVWKVQTDTYQREMERYGANTIEDSETLFWLDSELVLTYLRFKASFKNPTMELLFSFKTIDSLLTAFSLTNTQKLALMQELQLDFKEEFNAGKTLKKELDKQYRTLAHQMEGCLTNVTHQGSPDLLLAIEQKQNLAKITIANIKQKVQSPLSGFLKSHIHMMVNRQYSSKQRMYELVIYDHLYRHYKKAIYSV